MRLRPRTQSEHAAGILPYRAIRLARRGVRDRQTLTPEHPVLDRLVLHVDLDELARLVAERAAVRV